MLATLLALAGWYYIPWANECRASRLRLELRLAVMRYSEADMAQYRDLPNVDRFPRKEIGDYVEQHQALDLAGCPGSPIHTFAR